METLFSQKLKVGITSIIAILILFVGTLWVKKYNPLERKEKITVLFRHANGIAAGDPVNVSGIKVGEVIEVKLSEDNKALIKFSFNKDVRLHSDCVFAIKDIGLMGDKALEIIPGNRTVKT